MRPVVAGQKRFIGNEGHSDKLIVSADRDKVRSPVISNRRECVVGKPDRGVKCDIGELELRHRGGDSQAQRQPASSEIFTNHRRSSGELEGSAKTQFDVRAVKQLVRGPCSRVGEQSITALDAQVAKQVEGPGAPERILQPHRRTREAAVKGIINFCRGRGLVKILVEHFGAGLGTIAEETLTLKLQTRSETFVIKQVTQAEPNVAEVIISGITDRKSTRLN